MKKLSHVSDSLDSLSFFILQYKRLFINYLTYQRFLRRIESTIKYPAVEYLEYIVISQAENKIIQIGLLPY